ncbi:MAG: NirD/YgiW/YdeI family stress tolerance protein [Desulfocapsaceae bacterium]|nr:NirD/YgiW/YdeI family stress tolerance protein [Desulfocapsaceae bacterium]
MKTYFPIFIFLLVLFIFPHAVHSADHEQITNIADISRGASVTLQGKVTRILDEDEFRLQDDTGSVKIYIGWRNRVTVRVGESVKVVGFVDDDLVNAFRPEVYAQEIIRENGEQIELR